MTGAFDRLFGNTPYDLNRDGKIDAGEEAYINELLFSDDVVEEIDEEEELRDEIEFMDPDERREAIDGKELAPEQINRKAGIIIGLEHGKSYKIGYYVGTKYYEKHNRRLQGL